MKITIHVEPGYEHFEPFVRTLAENGVPDEGECIYSGRNHLYRITVSGTELNVKDFHTPRFPNSVIYTNLRKSKARRSCENATELIKRGIATPFPVAWVEVKDGIRLDRSYYVSLQSPSTRNLRTWQDWPETERDEVLEAYARYMVRLHEAGVQHHDLSPGNVIWRRDADGEIIFEIVDLNRMTLRPRPLTGDESFSNFRNINLVEDETARLGRAYGRARGIDPAEAAQRAVEVLRADQKRKARLKHFKTLFRK